MCVDWGMSQLPAPQPSSLPGLFGGCVLSPQPCPLQQVLRCMCSWRLAVPPCPGALAIFPRPPYSCWASMVSWACSPFSCPPFFPGASVSLSAFSSHSCTNNHLSSFHHSLSLRVSPYVRTPSSAQRLRPPRRGPCLAAYY